MLALDLPIAPAHRCTAAPPHVFLLADDLTGALDSAVHFAAHNQPVHHLLRAKTSPNPVWALSTETRNSTPEAAAQTLKHALRNHPESLRRQTLVFLKLDSAGRGPIATTILTAAELLRPHAILFAPASPQHGRTILNSCLTVRDIANQSTSLPLLSLFPAEVHHRLAPLPIASPEQLREHMLQALSIHRDIFLPDVTTPHHLDSIVAAAQSLPHRVLWAGSSGLASALASTLSTPTALPLPPPTQPLLICGTQHPVTQLQLHHLRNQRNAAILELDPAATAPAQLRAQFTALLPTSLLITGGDTAAFVLSALAADSVAIHGELSPGIPWGRISGGLAHNALLATKSGGFGGHHALIRAIDTLSGHPA